jgi:C4-dicarboxylate-specific signal transduction histidine kinase
VTKSKPQWVPVDINLAVNNVLTLAEYDLRANQVHVKSYLSPGLSLVYADTIQIEQIILNLIRNGIDATQDRVPWAEITLESTTQNENVYLYVRDNGTGLSEEMLDHLFDPFFSTKKHPMGLGRTICQSIVESFGGHLSARNLPEGGAEFCMRLPKLSPSSFAQYATGEKTS